MIIWLTGTAAVCQEASYDGVWWMKSSANQQDGFILGYGECYADSDGYRVRVMADDANVRIAMSTYYQGHQSQRARPVARVLRDVWGGHIPLRDATPTHPGLGWRERHGFLDGFWWQGSDPAEQLGFVEGYVTCHNNEEIHDLPLREPISAYVSQLGSWYDRPGEPAAVSQRRAVKISEVMTRLQASAENSTR
jgi:hypothetical protein